MAVKLAEPKMKTAPDFRREPIFRGGGPISPVGFVAVPLCLGESGRVKEGEISRSRNQVGQSWLVWRLPLVVSCHPLIATAVPGSLALAAGGQKKMKPPERGLRGEVPRIWMGILVGSTPVQGIRRAFKGEIA